MHLDDQNHDKTAHIATPLQQFLEQCRQLPLSERKQLIRDIQYETSSAWMFYMGVRPDKQVLLLLNRLTTFPLSLARLCAHVVVFGLSEKDQCIFNTLAQAKGIDNYTCIDDIGSLASKFDLIILLGEEKDSAFIRSLATIRKFIHADTEVWTLAGNNFSPASIKARVRSLFRKSNSRTTHSFAGTFSGRRNQTRVRTVRSQFKNLGIVPFASLGLSPTDKNPRVIKPISGSFEQLSPKYSYPFRQRLTTEEIAVGAAERELTQSFLTRLLEALPNSAFSAGEMVDFAVFPGGKVHVFADFKIAAKQQPIVIKLPLNHHAVKRAKVNQMTLGYINSSEVDVLCNRVPQPITEGIRDNQAYFVESIVPGEPMASLPDFRRNARSLVMQVFPFWLAVQRGFAKEVTIDEALFDQLIYTPVSAALQFVQAEGADREFKKQLHEFLWRHFLNKKFTLSLGHGDFSAKNILYDRQLGKISGVIDWDMARLQTFPILDVFHFFLHIRRTAANSPKTGTLLNIMLSDKLFQKIREMYRDAFGFEASMLKPMLVIYWAARLAGHLGTIKNLDDGFVRRNYYEPLQVIKKIMNE